MSDAKKCDRCGGYYDKLDPGGERPSWSGHHIYKVTVEGYTGEAVKTFDLCGGCAADIMDSLQNYVEPDTIAQNKETMVMTEEEYNKMMEGALCEECEMSIGQKHLKEVCPKCIHFHDQVTYGQSACRVCIKGASMFRYNDKKFETKECDDE